MWRKPEQFILAGIVGFWATMLPYFARYQNLSRDEAFSWRVSKYEFAELIARWAADVHPPLFYLLLKVWVGVFGECPTALRGLSTFLALMALLMVYLVVCEAIFSSHKSGQRRDDVVGRWRAERWAALFAAAAIATHWSEIQAASMARMYALGVLLTALSSWLLLRALRAETRTENAEDVSVRQSVEPVTALHESLSSPQRTLFRWSAYAIALAALLYTHNYGHFTMAAQGLFVAGGLFVRGRTEGWSKIRITAAGYAYALALTAIVYAPWLPVLRAQVAEVQENYWIPPASTDQFERVMWSWATGTKYVGPGAQWALYAFMAGALAWVGARGDPAGWFFLLLWIVPWELAIGFSVVTRRSIFLDRCLVFAHVGWIGYLAVLTTRLPGPITKALFATIALTISVAGTIQELAQIPREPAAIVHAIDFLQGAHEPGDLVLVDAARSLNSVLYYAKQVGFEKIEVKARVSPFSKGHQVHVASLEADDVYWDDSELADYERIWTAGEDAHAVTVPQAFLRVESKTFGSGASRYALVLYERKPDEPAGKR